MCYKFTIMTSAVFYNNSFFSLEKSDNTAGGY